MSIIRKNLKATKGKKKWRRNIDIQPLLDELEEQKKQIELENKVKEKLKDQSLFFIDNEANTKRRRREPLDPDRFKKKQNNVVHSINENKKVNKIIKNKLMKQDNQEEVQNDQTLNTDDNNKINDIWADTTTITNSIKKYIPKDDIKPAAILKPVDGQSYNPSFKAHKELLKTVIAEEIKKEQEPPKKVKPVKELLAKRKRPKSLIQKIEQEEAQKRKMVKKINHDILHIKQINQEIEEENEKIKNRIKQKQEEKEKLRKAVEEGKLATMTKRLGRGKYKPPVREFQLEEDLVGNMRSIKPNDDLIRERFDSVFRRNILEAPADKIKRKQRKVPTVKWHNVDRDSKLGKGNQDFEVYK